MYLSIILLSLITILLSCSTQVKDIETSEDTKIKSPERYQPSKKYIEALSFVTNHQRILMSEIVDEKGKTLDDYAKVLGIEEDQLSTFKRVLKQNLPKLIQYNEPDAFQSRIERLLLDKKVDMKATRPQIQ